MTTPSPVPETTADPVAELAAIRERWSRVAYVGLKPEVVPEPGRQPSWLADIPRLLDGYDALLKLHRLKPNYGLAFSPSTGAPLCGHDPDTDPGAHFEGDDGEWYCRDKVTGQTCRTCADEQNADLWAEWPCVTYHAIAAALAGGEVPR